MASTLDDRWFWGILIIMRGTSGFRGGVLWGGFRRTVTTLAWVRASVVVPLALLLEREPPRDVVQLGSVGQINKHLQANRKVFKSYRKPLWIHICIKYNIKGAYLPQEIIRGALVIVPHAHLQSLLLKLKCTHSWRVHKKVSSFKLKLKQFHTFKQPKNE